MNLYDLRLFLHLCGTLHFGKSSRACHVSPSTLSRVIQRLEEASDQQFFERDRRHVKMTSAGRIFRSYAEEAIQNWNRLQADLKQGGESLRGELNLYCSVTAAYSILPDILKQFRENYPEVQISLTTGDAALALDKVMDGTADISVAGLPEKMSNRLASRIIMHTPLLFIGPKEDGPIKAQLSGKIDWTTIPMIFPESGLIRTHLRHWFRDQGIQPRIYDQVAGHEAIISLVSLGFGVGVIPELVLEKSIMNPNVEALPVTPALPDFHVGLCTKKHRLSSALIQAFWEIRD